MPTSCRSEDLMHKYCDKYYSCFFFTAVSFFVCLNKAVCVFVIGFTWKKLCMFLCTSDFCALSHFMFCFINWKLLEYYLVNVIKLRLLL